VIVDVNGLAVDGDRGGGGRAVVALGEEEAGAQQGGEKWT
jgi:hypothetical protein